jgi:beta-hydroxylase
VGEVLTPYHDGVGILFDDTEDHEAWNRGPAPRVTLFCELVRPVHGPARLANAGVQRLLALDPRYRRAPRRADAALHLPSAP